MRTDLISTSIAELSRWLGDQTITSRQLIEQSLAAVKNPDGEGARVFLAVQEKAALAAADRVDEQRRQGVKLSQFAGIPISVKDNFDQAGVTTLAGSRVLSGSAPATRDSSVVARLKEAGAVIVGRTNMTEFAYSGLGINPHYGTPRNVFDRANARIPGGSSSGAVVSVADGMAAGAIGTDTGGSLRIPPALNGLVGFKPTARRVPLDGVLPLSLTLDSAGPIAKSVADCALIDQVLAAVAHSIDALPTVRGLRFAVPKTVFLHGLSTAVAAAFYAALTRLSAAGASITELPATEFARAAEINPKGILSAVEAFWWHRPLIPEHAAQYDPRVIARIRPGEVISATNYNELLQRRQRFIRDIEATFGGYDALLMPTTAETAPTIAEAVKDDESYYRFNGQMLRNPALVNFFDGCALSVPCHEPGSAPVGLMIAGMANADQRILALGHAVESTVRRT